MKKIITNKIPTPSLERVGVGSIKGYLIYEKDIYNSNLECSKGTANATADGKFHTNE